MQPLTHLLIPFAGGGSQDSDALLAALPALPNLPNLQKLLARLAPERTIETPIDGPALPYELALATELGLPNAPGYIPWAAHETGTVGTPCAFVQLCHLQIGMNQVQMLGRDALQVTEDESRALLAASVPWFAEDGIALSYHLSGMWLAQGECFRDLLTTSPDRVIGQPVSPGLMQMTGAGAAMLQRLQHEMQMLFYDHPTTDARLLRGQLAPNAIWITGAGVLSQAVAPRPELQVESRLAQAIEQGYVPGFGDIWQAIDASSIAALAECADARLTLCGERQAITFGPRSGSWAAGLARRLLQTAPTPKSILERL